MRNRYDTVIVGAGPGGSAAAHYLAKAGLKVLVVDKFDFPRDKTCGDGLTPLALEVLNDMGLLDSLFQVGACIKGLEIIAPGGHSTVASLPSPNGQAGQALVVPRLTLDNVILERAVASGAKFQGRIHVTTIEQDKNGVVVQGGRHGRSASIRARMAIVATGASVKLLLNMGLLSKTPSMLLAARAYFENVGELNDYIRFYFDGVPLPGYGWVFPLPNSAANIGAGFSRNGQKGHRLPAMPAAVFEEFIQTPPLQAILAHAQQTGPIKGYPLRIDFLTAPTFGRRVLLVGEAAGLVNPLTGEGIDYALESGKIAAQHLIKAFESGDLSHQNLMTYDRLLRRRYQLLFLFCSRMQNLLKYRRLINRLTKAADRHPDLKMLLVKIVQGQQDISSGLSRKTILKGLFALATAR